MSTEHEAPQLQHRGDCWYGSFRAMASPCEVLMDEPVEHTVRQVLDAVATEAWRIEKKFSRYRDDNIVHRINHSQGQPVEIDDETARMLRFADELHDMSEGLFDITSGVLRKLWRFDGSDKLPDQHDIDALLPHIGWRKTRLDKARFTLPAGMEIDLGGIGKEYAVDRCTAIAAELSAHSSLINFGGDLRVTHPRTADAHWSVGRLITGRDDAVGLFELQRGAIATSGDANRYLLKDGVRYSHVLNPKTGWPVENAPHTVSVAAGTCLEAGMLSTLAMLHGGQAEAFLKLQEVPYWID